MRKSHFLVFLCIIPFLLDDEDEDVDGNALDITCTLRNNKYHLDAHAPADTSCIILEGMPSWVITSFENLSRLRGSPLEGCSMYKGSYQATLPCPQNTYSSKENVKDGTKVVV